MELIRKYRTVILFIGIFIILTASNAIKNNPINWLENLLIAGCIAIAYKILNSFTKKNNSKESSFVKS